MALYTLHDISLDVQPEELETRAKLAQLWSNLTLVRTDGTIRKSLHHLSIRLHENGGKVPPLASCRFQASGFSGLEHADGFYVSDNSSVFHLQLGSGHGDAYLSPS